MPDPLPPTPSTSTTSIRSRNGQQHLLSLAAPALSVGEDVTLEEESDEKTTKDLWRAITKASDLLKDGDRLENLIWRLNWGQKRLPRKPSLSSFSVATGSSTSLHTPLHEHSPHDFPPTTNAPTSPSVSIRSDRTERRTLGDALKLLMEDETSFKDWVTDAKNHRTIPEISVPSVPDTPIADVEIRLVEPTPVPSRVGSLGGSLGAVGLLGSSNVPRTLEEDREGEADEEAEELDSTINPREITKASQALPRSPKRKGKFFLHSSPSKGSGSESAASPSINPATATDVPSSSANEEPESPGPVTHVAEMERRESGSSSAGGVMMKSKKSKSRRTSQSSNVRSDATTSTAHPRPSARSPMEKRRNVSLSTMRGKYQAEKRKVAEAIATKAEEEDAAAEGSGWEDEDEECEQEDELENGQEEDWSDEELATSPGIRSKKEGSSKRRNNRPSSSRLQDRRRSSQSRDSGHSTSNLDLTALLSRPRKSRYTTPPGQSPGDPPRVPAPTPLKRMSKKERLKAAEERAKIEAELEAQRKREMFAKQQIFGSKPAGSGLLSGMFKRGASMVNLSDANAGVISPQLRPSPTLVHLPSLSQSPVGPSMLRSKSAVAMPVETGISVTRTSPHKSKLSEEISSVEQGSDESRHRNSSPTKELKPSANRGPTGVALETSDEESADEDDYLATSDIQRRIEALAAKKDARAQPVPQPAPTLPPVFLDDNGVVQPLSPTTRRRTIIMREMSESLRRNLILEREKSSTSRAALKPTGRSNSFGHQPPHARPPPSTHTSILPARGSSSNLAQLHNSAYENGQTLNRNRSDPSIPQTTSPTPDADRTPTPSPDSSSRPKQPMITRRRTQPTVLGGGFLRPLTRVGESPPIGRTQSSANLQSRGSSPLSPVLPEATAMQRSSTEGPAGNDLQRREQTRRRELALRNHNSDTSYRSHGW